MNDVSFYFLIGIIALITHILINFDVLFGVDYKTDYVNARPYRRFLFAIADFFVIDALWGLSSMLNIFKLMRYTAMAYNLCLVYIILCWMAYISDYLEIEEKVSKLFKLVGKIFAIFVCTVLATNLILSRFLFDNEKLVYSISSLKYLGLFAIIAIFGSSSIFAIKNMNKKKTDSVAILCFSIAPILSSFIQMLKPSFPAYSIGFLFGSCFIHTFLYEQYKRETEIKLIKASKAKTDYLYSMSHDIRTPMNAIVGYTELIENSYDDKEKCLSYVNKIKVSSNFLLSLINNILDIARIESGNATLNEEIWDSDNIDKDLYSVFEKQAADKNIKFTINKQIEHTYFYCDKVKFREVLLNLVSNAIKYTPNNGSVTIDVKELESKKEGYARYVVDVKDTGVGMSEEYLPHVFDKFVRETTSKGKDSGGTGLGLPIVKSIIDLMGGTIEVKSKLGEGTTFTFCIDLRIGEKPVCEEEKVEIKDLSNKNILVVEDNDINAELITIILQDLNIIVDRAKDGGQAFEKIMNKQYDCVLMDVQMPVYNGYEVTKMVRSENNNIPIIAMTASAFEEDRISSIEVGMNDFISKPVEINKLKTVLSKNIK